jgi:hypothetical protein
MIDDLDFERCVQARARARQRTKIVGINANMRYLRAKVALQRLRRFKNAGTYPLPTTFVNGMPAAPRYYGVPSNWRHHR